MKKRIPASVICVILLLTGCVDQPEIKIGGKTPLSEVPGLGEEEEITEEPEEETVDIEGWRKGSVGLKLVSPERKHHEAKPDVRDAKMAAAGHELTGSTVPRVDIVMDEDYLLYKSEYTPAKISISGAGSYNIEPKDGEVRIRGNSTSLESKLPLKIKFDEAQEVFGRPAEKSWTLLANYYDKTSLHNKIAFDMYGYLAPEGSFVPLCEFVDLYVNDVYCGLYTLCDQVETGEGRVSIRTDEAGSPEMTDYLIEQDFRAYFDGGGTEGLDWFYSSWTEDCFTVECPDGDCLNAEKTAYIQDYMDQIYEAGLLGRWDVIQSLIDVDSFIAGFMVADMIKSVDIRQSSVYFYKKAGDKLYFGPLWDCDLSFGSGEEGDIEGSMSEGNYLFGALIKTPEFRHRYIDRYNEVRDEMLEFVNGRIDEYTGRYGKELDNEFQNWTMDMNYCCEEMQQIYDHKGQTEFMKTWFADRLEWLDMRYGVIY